MIRRLALLAEIALVFAFAGVGSGCAKRAPAPVTGSPAPPAATEQATVAPGAPASAAPAASGAAESPPAGAIAPSPTPTGPVNLLALAQGTIVREWPPTATGQSPFNLVHDEVWKSKAGAGGAFTFVFELAAPAQINSLGFVAYEVNGDASNAAQSVRVEGSTQSADGGFTTIGDYTLKDTSGEQDFPLSAPVTARWLRVTIQQRAPDFTVIQSVRAYGKLQSTPPKSLAGVWLFDRNILNGDDALVSGSRLPVSPDPKLIGPKYDLAQVVEENGVLRMVTCRPGGYVTSAGAGIQNGLVVSWQPADWGFLEPNYPYVVNAEGTIMAGPLSDIAIRLPPGPTCTKVEAPAGSGRAVLVLTPEGRQFVYGGPPMHADQYRGFRFTPLAVALLTSDALAHFETVIMDCVDRADSRIAPWQAKVLIDFVSAGHKLIIYDADKCSAPLTYSFLPYQFKTANPGAQGAGGKNLFLVESDTLGSDDKNDRQHFWDPHVYVSDSNNQIGDANTVTTSDPHWCGHLFGTNALNVNGFMQMYSVLGRGLIIYDGFDQDNSGLPEVMQLTALELQQPVPALLPCTALVAGKFVIEPSKTLRFTLGRPATLQVPMQVLANQGYAGTVSLSSKAPTDAPWKATLSTSQAILKGGTAPLNLTISVPADAQPGGHEFVVNGDDGQGNTASATITLVAQVPQKVVKVKPVTKGCTEKLTLGADALFEFGEATLTPTAQKTLALLGPTISKGGKHPVQIYGYTDSIGSDSYNQALSEQRARSVRNWLAAHGYIRASTSIKGFGKQHPVAPNTNPNGSDNPQGRAKNRRVEVLIDTCR